ncbi:MAG: hypothetical protein D6689_15650 [Deltaproteobacteria bacterium]|nr:MAG: hypothetical protein D6689_15650 [Deltaproteobacteria bacterium]
MTSPRSADPFWTDKRARAAAIGGGVVLFAGLWLATFRYDFEVPPRPPKPKPTAISAARFSESVDRNPAAWAAYLEMDARTYGVAQPTPADMAQVFPYRSDTQRHVLDPADDAHRAVEVAGLRLEASIAEQPGRPERALVLRIENRTDAFVAYRVVTAPTRGTQHCMRKLHLAHNALALEPRGVAVRSECLYRDGLKLAIKSVETMAIPPLSYFYVSRLFPPQVGYDRRVVQGHKPPRGDECRLILPAVITNGIRSGAVTWRDLIDFYARHRCDTYTFPIGYKHFERPEQVPLPAAGARR